MDWWKKNVEVLAKLGHLGYCSAKSVIHCWYGIVKDWGIIINLPRYSLLLNMSRSVGHRVDKGDIPDMSICYHFQLLHSRKKNQRNKDRNNDWRGWKFNTFWKLLVVDKFRILNRYIPLGSITKPVLMFAEASPSLRIEFAFPQGIQNSALTAVWRIGEIAVRDQQSGSSLALGPWRLHQWLMTGPPPF